MSCSKQLADALRYLLETGTLTALQASRRCAHPSSRELTICVNPPKSSMRWATSVRLPEPVYPALLLLPLRAWRPVQCFFDLSTTTLSQKSRSVFWASISETIGLR